MNILFNIAHPGQVHLFKNAIKILRENGHNCRITTVDKDVSLALLNACNFDYDIVGSAKPTLFSKATELLKIDYNLYKIAKSFKPDILVGGVGNAYVAHVGKMIRKPSIVFDDTEHAKIEHIITDPFATTICTPSSFNKDLGKKQVRYDGYHELAYLHPNNFTPNAGVLNEIGLSNNEKFIIMRLVAWDADHDIGQYGITDKIAFVKELEKYARIFITSEVQLDSELEQYKIKVSPEKLHDLLYHATLHIGEGGTTAVESAVLGTPSIYISSLVGTMGNFVELEEKYGLILNYKDSQNALKKAIELIKNPNVKSEWNEKRNQLLKEKIDVTSFIVNFIEKYHINNK